MFPSTGPGKQGPPDGAGESGASGRPSKIRRGRFGLTRAELEVYHRDRILNATLNIVGVAGYSELSVSSITEVAGVTRQAFHALYESPQAAFLDAYDDAITGMLARLGATHDEQDVSLDAALVRGVEEAVTYLVDEPARAALVLVEVHAAGPEAVERQQSALDAIVRGVAGMLERSGIAEVDADRGARFGVGAVHEALRTRVTRGELEDLTTIASDLSASAFPMATG
jgi:AcrR family transcriptional regulator